MSYSLCSIYLAFCSCLSHGKITSICVIICQSNSLECTFSLIQTTFHKLDLLSCNTCHKIFQYIHSHLSPFIRLSKGTLIICCFKTSKPTSFTLESSTFRKLSQNVLKLFIVSDQKSKLKP